jgi:hypothetical protein
VYVDDHCQEQELSNDLPVSYEMQEIFCGGIALPLKIRAGLYIRSPTPLIYMMTDKIIVSDMKQNNK